MISLLKRVCAQELELKTEFDGNHNQNHCRLGRVGTRTRRMDFATKAD